MLTTSCWVMIKNCWHFSDWSHHILLPLGVGLASKRKCMPVIIGNTPDVSFFFSFFFSFLPQIFQTTTHMELPIANLTMLYAYSVGTPRLWGWRAYCDDDVSPKGPLAWWQTPHNTPEVAWWCCEVHLRIDWYRSTPPYMEVAIWGLTAESELVCLGS